ncbi:MAG: winged helix-turn-helix transcriptional regulator, partial [Asgard group archaeon]|nr:winged helix-turn-helix transcriptional regulator [Asgard group archaeon]
WLTVEEEKTTTQEYLKEIKVLVEDIQKQAEFNEKLDLYSALGNKIRFTMVQLLDQKPLCTCVLAEVLNLKESTISHHLKILEKAGLIIGLKKGSFVSYFTKKNILKELTK